MTSSTIQERVLRRVKESLRKKYPTLDKRVLETRAKALTRRILRQVKSTFVEGFLVADRGKIDLAELRRRKCLAFAKREGREKAILEGYIDSEGNPLDKFGRILPESIFLRSFLGVFRREHAWKKGTLTLSGKRASDTLPLFKPLKLFVNIKDGSELQLRAGRYFLYETLVESEEETESYEIERVIRDYFQILDLSSLLEPREIGVYEVDVQSLDLVPREPSLNRIMIVDDDTVDTPILTLLPPYLEIDFAEGSRVFLFAERVRGRKSDYLVARGVYALPKYKVEAGEPSFFSIIESLDLKSLIEG